MEVFWQLLKSARPRQWVKNLALFPALIFSGLLFHPGLFWITVKAALTFSLMAGSIYIFNDLTDLEADKLHPFKRKRPIASGRLPLPVAVFACLSGVMLALGLATTINLFFFLTLLAYLVIQIFYTFIFKKQPILDVLTIASGYILRVYAGAFAINAHMDVWFLLTVISASLFLAIGKRRSELTLLRGSGTTAQIRSTLKRYTEPLLDVYTAMFATATWLTYAIFTFNQPRIIPGGKVLTIMSLLPRTLVLEKLLMITSPLVIYGVMRYLLLIYERNEGESPERVFLSDRPLIITVVVWGILVVGLLYYVG
ncbi:decaprenyl-phosphate phosphoribosyltransferase [Candidatus Collierbacteria bacterium]|nr:decaprenyl-phosphate phosphoribosyltransferase [Candidatus Collierbacteria bacterium]